VTYLVLEHPQVSITINGFSLKVQRDYVTIKNILTATPRLNPMFSAIREYALPSGLRYYEYADNILPAVLQYRVFDADNSWQRGLVWIAGAMPY